MISKNRGFTLVELCITLVISSIITLAIMNIFLLNQQTFSMIQATNESQETGRIILNFLNRSINRAGYTIYNDKPFPFNPPCDKNSRHCTRDSQNKPGDRLAIQRLLDNGRTCAGTRIHNLTHIIVIDSFWIDNATTLYCQTFEASSGLPIRTRGNSRMRRQPLTDGVVAMHILYGIPDLSSINGNISRFISGTELDALGDKKEQPVWQTVKAIRISLLTESFTDIRQPKEPKKYLLLDSEPLIFNDRKSRTLINTTIALMLR